MAEVFAGVTLGAEGFARKVAIKRVLPAFSDDPQFAQMFVAEAQLSSRLVHPNVVSTIDFERDETGALFLVMELVEGRDLGALAATGLIPADILVYIAVECLRGLGYAHDLRIGSTTRGVVHRDVSPHNILLSWEGAVKVSDFGIAKARHASEATASLYLKGKPAYMSPEQASGQALDGRSDLFAVGVMLWELLVGRRLFVAEDTRGTLAAVMFGTIPRPRTLRPEVPRDLEKVVMKLLERERSARYASAEAAIGDLLRCADVRGGRDALMSLLRERFHSEAPPKQSVELLSRAPSREAATIASAPRAKARVSSRLVRVLIVGLVAAGVSIGMYVLMARMRHVAPAAVEDARSYAGLPVHTSLEGWFRVDEVTDAQSVGDAAAKGR